MSKESERELSELSKAFDRASTSITRTGQAFGELADSSKEWTIISRVLSGTGMWRLQNQIRAVGQTINVLHRRQEEQRKSTLEAIEANIQLADSVAAVEKALGMSDAQIAKTPLAMMFTKAGRDGIKEYREMWKEAGKQLQKAETGVMKSLTPSSASKFLAGSFFGGKEGDDEDAGIGQFVKRGIMSTRTFRAGAATMRFGARQYDRMKGLRDIGMLRKKDGSVDLRANRSNYRVRASRAWDRFKKKMGAISGKVSQFFVVGAAFLLKATLGFLALITGIALLVFIFKKLELKKRLQAFEKKFGYFRTLFEQVKDILTAVFDIFKAAFAGDSAELWKGLKDLFWAWLGMLETIFKILLQGIWSVIKALPGLIWQGLKAVGKGIWGGVFGRANGGVVRSGELTLVGERGPELVRLPSGARVHTNSESRRMSGGTINVHVNGRVGASDAEIRDIASKVAREINTQMNRQAHTVGRF